MRNLANILFIFLLLVPAFSSAQTRVQRTAVIDLSAALNADAPVLLSTIADNIEYVPLETTPECILGDYRNIKAEVLKEYIVVYDKHQLDDVPLKLFSRQGKYIGEIGAIGKPRFI